MKRKTKKTRQVKQYVPAFLREIDRPRGQVAMGVIHDQTAHGAQRLAAWYRKASVTDQAQEVEA